MKGNLYYNIVGTWILFTYIIIISNIIGPIYVGWVNQLFAYGTLLLVVFSNYKRKIPLYVWGLALCLIFSTLLHYSNPNYTRPFQTTFHWIFLLFFFNLALYYYKGKWLFYLIVFFFILNSLIGCYEKITLSYVFTYDIDMLKHHEDLNEQGSTIFRAFSLLGHPLYNANITSVIMAYILFNENINKYVKAILMIIGFGGLLSFNSRAAIIVWIFIFLFYYTSKYKYSFVLLIVFFCLFLIQPIISFLLNEGLLGRIGEGFNDASSETRWLCYAVFGYQDWNLYSILGGVGTIYYPYSEISLENGILLTLGYWGWFFGVYKVITELFITYFALKKIYSNTKIVIIFMASWGVAFCNNNSYNPLFLSFLIITTVAFRNFGIIRKNNK